MTTHRVFSQQAWMKDPSASLITEQLRTFLSRKETQHVYHHNDVAGCDLFTDQASHRPSSVSGLLCYCVCWDMALQPPGSACQQWSWLAPVHRPISRVCWPFYSWDLRRAHV